MLLRPVPVALGSTPFVPWTSGLYPKGPEWAWREIAAARAAVGESHWVRIAGCSRGEAARGRGFRLDRLGHPSGTDSGGLSRHLHAERGLAICATAKPCEVLRLKLLADRTSRRAPEQALRMGPPRRPASCLGRRSGAAVVVTWSQASKRSEPAFSRRQKPPCLLLRGGEDPVNDPLSLLLSRTSRLCPSPPWAASHQGPATRSPPSGPVARSAFWRWFIESGSRVRAKI
jgi:hypothetical protein